MKKAKQVLFVVVSLLMGNLVASCLPHEPKNKDSATKGQGSHDQEEEDKDKNKDKDNKKNSKSSIVIILAHQKKRFDVLETIIKKDIKYKIKFPGQDANNHALGTGIAKGSWSAEDHAQMITYIKDRITKLNQDFPGRIQFGKIGDYTLTPQSKPNCDPNVPNVQGVPGLQINGDFIIHVWGANEGNFNLDQNTPGPWGAGQATCFSHQRAGVFGISTMPSNDEQSLMAEDKMLTSY